MAWYNLGVLYEKQGRGDESGSAYRKAAGVDPRYADYLRERLPGLEGRGDD